MARQKKTGWEQLGIDPKANRELADAILKEMDHDRNVKDMVWLATGEKLPKPKEIAAKKSPARKKKK